MRLSYKEWYLDTKYIANLKLNDVVIIYVPVCDEDYAGFLHGKLVKCKSCTPVIEPNGQAMTVLTYSRKIQSEPGDFFSAFPRNQMGCDLTSPLVFAEEEFWAIHSDEKLRKKFFDDYPNRPNSAYAVSVSERECWWQTKRELERAFKPKRPRIMDLSDVTILPANEDYDDEDEDDEL